MAAVVHVVVRYRDERLAGRPPRDALLAAGHRVAAPITWACITDAVGFAALMWSRIAPVRDFGIMMAVGSLMVLVAIALLVPGLVLLGARQVPQHRTWADGSLGRSLERLVDGVRRHPRLVGGTALLLAAVALAGVARLRVETDFTKNFRAGSPIVEAYAFIEQRMGGAGVWDIVLRAPERLDRDFLERVQELERRLRRLQREGQSQPALTKVISLADAVAASEASPLLSRLPGEARLQGMQLAMPTFSQAMLARDPDTSQRYLRIMLRSPERQSADEKKWLIDQVRRVTEECFPAVDGQVQADVTGFYVLLTHLIDSLIGDQWLCFAVAAAGVGLAMLLAFRSLPLALIALVPNTLPILLVLGTMGWSGLPVNMGTAMIAAVSLGLSVDSSIHYVMSYQRRLRELGEPYSALRAVQRTVGRAAVFSTLALVSGFSVLCLSQFLPTLYFGVLVSLSMLGGLLGNLVLLPLMLQWLVLRPTTRNGA